MTIGTALAITAMLTAATAERPQPLAPHPAPEIALTPPALGGSNPVLREMAPAPGHWEVEDAPAYFSDRSDIRHVPAPGVPSAEAAIRDDPVAQSRP